MKITTTKRNYQKNNEIYIVKKFHSSIKILKFIKLSFSQQLTAVWKNVVTTIVTKFIEISFIVMKERKQFTSSKIVQFIAAIRVRRIARSQNPQKNLEKLPFWKPFFVKGNKNYYVRITEWVTLIRIPTYRSSLLLKNTGNGIILAFCTFTVKLLLGKILILTFSGVKSTRNDKH